MSASSAIVHLLNAASFAMLLFLTSVGLSLIFGVLGVINFAHGALYMVGAYLAFQVAGAWNLPFLVSLLVAPLVVAAIGSIIEVVFLRRIYARDVAVQLLLMFAFVLILDDVVRLIWGTGIKATPRPDLLDASVSILGRAYPTYGLFIIVLGPLVAATLWYLIARTQFGSTVRAASTDRLMASALGVDVPKVFTAVFALGAFLAGLGGTLAAPLRSVAPSMGENIIILTFIVVVIGGLGSFPGALVGALLLGLLQEFVPIVVPRSEMAVAYALMAAVLLARPRGLFPAPKLRA